MREAATVGRTAFGVFVFDAVAGVLLREGVPVAMGQRAAALLSALIEAGGQVVTKDRLMEAAWPGVTVEESNLTVQIAVLRKILAEGGHVDAIATVPRVGYRFLLPATRVDEAAPSPPPPVPPSLAVLPFDNMSGDPDQDYFADGVVEDILTALSRFRSFTVVARNSSFVYKGRSVDIRQVGRDLGVRYILEGSVRRSGDRLRITAQLIESANGHHIWADRYDGPVEDVFGFQDRITESVATIVEPMIRSAEMDLARRVRPHSVAAYDLFLRALPLHRAGTQPENAAAYALFERAVDLEPDNPVFRAWALDALLHRIILGWPMLTADDRAAVRVHIDRAMVLAGNDASVLGRCGNAMIQVTREYELGLATLRRATDSNPNDPDVMTFAGIGNLHCGDLDVALACFERVIRLSPNDPYAYISLTGIAHVFMIRRDFAAALETAERSFGQNAGFDPTYWMAIAANAQLGRLDDARRWLGRYLALSPGSTLSRLRRAQPPDPARMGPILEGLARAGLPED